MKHHHEHSHDRSFDDGPPSDYEVLSRAMQELLEAKGVISAEQVRRRMEQFDAEFPQRGAQVIAHAWVDGDFKRRLLADGTAAVQELGIPMGQTKLVVVENTPQVHNLVVCTLCSCYPWPTLGLPPVWYKAAPYRSRAVADPRGVLQEFGVAVPDDVEVRVWDSNAELRYLVLPMRPAGTEALTEQQLAELVTRDSMIGTGLPKAPGQV
jgi:nitrile hydratase